jgi:hypothetical protein
MRYDTVYLIVTVGVRKNSYRVVTRAPKSIKQNEFIFRFSLKTDEDKWKKRVVGFDLPLINPPESVELEKLELKMGRTVGQIVADEIANRPAPGYQEAVCLKST